MSEKHLETGAPFPPVKDGAIRLYSMRFCPFAQRSRLALAAKGIKFEVVNCNLARKPEWLLERNPKGLVPVLEHDGKVVFESLIVNDYLDEVFPGTRSLNPKDPYQKAKDGILVDLFGSQITANFYKVARSQGKDEDAKENMLKGVAKMETELKSRGTKFFRGDQPGMVDYNVWPWLERMKEMQEGIGVTVYGDNTPLLNDYVDRMFADEAVKSTLNPKELRDKFYASYKAGNVQYDFD